MWRLSFDLEVVLRGELLVRRQEGIDLPELWVVGFVFGHEVDHFVSELEQVAEEGEDRSEGLQAESGLLFFQGIGVHGIDYIRWVGGE